LSALLFQSPCGTDPPGRLPDARNPEIGRSNQIMRPAALLESLRRGSKGRFRLVILMLLRHNLFHNFSILLSR
jgi:hypothetical protein